MDDPKYPWMRQRNEDGELEPNRWYSRFADYYLPQGPDRTIEEAYRRWKSAEGKGRAKSAPRLWYEYCGEWDWKGRAAAYDAHERAKRRAAEEERREQARKSRLQVADAGIVASWAALRVLTQQAQNKSAGGEEVGREVLKAVESLSRSFARFAKEQRLDYGEATERSETLSVDAVLDMLPPAFREDVLNKLAEEVG